MYLQHGTGSQASPNNHMIPDAGASQVIVEVCVRWSCCNSHLNGLDRPPGCCLAFLSPVRCLSGMLAVCCQGGVLILLIILRQLARCSSSTPGHRTCMHSAVNEALRKVALNLSLARQPCAGYTWNGVTDDEVLRAIAHQTVGCWVLVGTAASCLPQRSILCGAPRLLLRLLATANQRRSLLATLIGNQQDAGMR